MFLVLSFRLSWLARVGTLSPSTALCYRRPRSVQNRHNEWCASESPGLLIATGSARFSILVHSGRARDGCRESIPPVLIDMRTTSQSTRPPHLSRQFLVTTFREQRRLFDDPISELRIGIFSDSVVTVHEHACLSEVLDLLEAQGGWVSSAFCIGRPARFLAGWGVLPSWLCRPIFFADECVAGSSGSFFSPSSHSVGYPRIYPIATL